MVLNIAAILPQARTLLNSTLPDSSVNSRTHATVACRVDDSGRNMRYHGLPYYVQFPIWDITLPDGEDVAAGDVLAVTRFEDSTVQDYYITVVRNPTTFSVSTDLEAVRAFSSGHGSIPVPPNCLASFTNPLTGEVLLLDAYVHPVGDDMTDAGGTPSYRWQLLFDATATYGDGTTLQANTPVTLFEVASGTSVLGLDTDGQLLAAAITRPRRTFGLMPVAMAFVNEQP